MKKRDAIKEITHKKEIIHRYQLELSPEHLRVGKTAFLSVTVIHHTWAPNVQVPDNIYTHIKHN